MAIILFNFISSFQIKCRIPFSLLILVFTFFTTIILAFSQTPTNSCLLDIQTASSDNINSSCTRGNWDGFTGNKCCGSIFDGYLRALGKRANQTGNIFLKSTEQKECLNYSCGIEKLNSGQGGCSDYSVADVVNNLGNDLRMLGEDCKVLDESNMSCTACVVRWETMRTSRKVENDVCRFAVLISLTSQRIDDDKWIQEVYKCLGERSLSLVNEGITTRRSKRIGSGLWILIGGLVGITIVIVALAWILSRKSKKAKVLVKAATIGSASEDYSCRKISVKEVYSATDNLNESNFIGQGIAGKVYKGILSNGQDVAIKHIINDGQMETFVREVTSLSHVRHPNLVALLGHCEGEEDCFLVYELCHKGNLAEWLFGKYKTLSWIQRLEIAIDCARGLWFLHTYPEGCIVHRDIKPTNILLCANFRGKLADFGLSKVIDTGLSYVSSEVRGTFGYVDPEYRKNHHVNSSGDVYSFGIVLLQLISGQRVINLDANKPMPLDKMAKMLTKGGNMIEFSDPKLDGEFPEDAFELVIKLALTCTGMKQQRPSMEQVVGKLEKVLDMSTRDESTVPQFKLSVD